MEYNHNSGGEIFKRQQSEFYLSTLRNKIYITRKIVLKYQMLHINHSDAEHIYLSLCKQKKLVHALIIIVWFINDQNFMNDTLSFILKIFKRN